MYVPLSKIGMVYFYCLIAVPEKLFPKVLFCGYFLLQNHDLGYECLLTGFTE